MNASSSSEPPPVNAPLHGLAIRGVVPVRPIVNLGENVTRVRVRQRHDGAVRVYLRRGQCTEEWLVEDTAAGWSLVHCRGRNYAQTPELHNPSITGAKHQGTVLEFNLATGETVRCSAEDYGRLVELPWRLVRYANQPRLTARVKGQQIIAVRFVLNASPYATVRLRDGDPLNLTRPNLIMVAP